MANPIIYYSEDKMLTDVSEIYEAAEKGTLIAHKDVPANVPLENFYEELQAKFPLNEGFSIGFPASNNYGNSTTIDFPIRRVPELDKQKSEGYGNVA